MTVIFYAVALLLVFGLFGLLFLRADAAKLAGGVRLAGPVAIGIIGAGLTLLGRVGLGGMLVSVAAGWHMRMRRQQAVKPSRGRRSTVRTAALEMQLDHDTGALSGFVLAGSHVGKQLDEMSLQELLDLGEQLVSDHESLQLLETYLDGKFPVWRDNAKADTGRWQAGAPASGAMTKQEAYNILGLEAGAGTTEIRQAHRRLMQRVHPDLGGSSFLAARINEAKEILLDGHK